MLEYDRIQANISCFPRRLQDVLKTSSAWHFSSSKTSWRHLVGIFTIRLPKMSSRRLQNVFKTSSRRVCKTSCNYVFKTSWKTKKCYTEDVLKTSWRRLQYVFTKTNVCWDGCVRFDEKIDVSKASDKSEAINLLRPADLTGKTRTL